MLYLCTRKQGTRNFLGLLTQIGIWCNGNTADSGPAFPGSSPGIPTRTLNEKSSSVFCVHTSSVPDTTFILKPQIFSLI